MNENKMLKKSEKVQQYDKLLAEKLESDRLLIIQKVNNENLDKYVQMDKKKEQNYKTKIQELKQRVDELESFKKVNKFPGTKLKSSNLNMYN